MTSVATRHAMQANTSKNTRPELMVRAALREAGLSGYRLHWKAAPGTPDICYPGRRVAIFVNGCFWHRCPYCALGLPKSNVAFWERKFARNRERDARDLELCVAEGWRVLVVWECRLKGARFASTMARIEDIVRACGQTKAGKPGDRPPQAPQALTAPRPRLAWTRGEGCIIEVGTGGAWKRRLARERLRAHGGQANDRRGRARRGAAVCKHGR